MNINLSCRCGALAGVASNLSPSNGSRIVCMCTDCQAFAHYLGKADSILDKHGGTDIFQMPPCDLQITQGIEHLSCMRLTDKGLYRWYAGCCKTPVANTMGSRKVPFAGVIHAFMAADGSTRNQVLGPIVARLYGRSAVGSLPPDANQTASLGFIVRTVRFLLSGWMRGRHTPSPFFDSSTGKPVVTPYVLSNAERNALRKLQGAAAQ
jgi:hypothetical protein